MWLRTQKGALVGAVRVGTQTDAQSPSLIKMSFNFTSQMGAKMESLVEPRIMGVLPLGGGGGIRRCTLLD